MDTNPLEITGRTAEKVAALVARSNLSKPTIAKKAGIPLTTFNRKIAGDTDFYIPEIYKLAGILEVSPGDLLPKEFEKIRIVYPAADAA